jgi:hypothetical protein
MTNLKLNLFPLCILCRNKVRSVWSVSHILATTCKKIFLLIYLYLVKISWSLAIHSVYQSHNYWKKTVNYCEKNMPEHIFRHCSRILIIWILCCYFLDSQVMIISLYHWIHSYNVKQLIPTVNFTNLWSRVSGITKHFFVLYQRQILKSAVITTMVILYKGRCMAVQLCTKIRKRIKTKIIWTSYLDSDRVCP